MVDSTGGNNSDREGFKYHFSGTASVALGTDDQDAAMKQQDRLLPIANVGRIMKKILPPNAKISKEAKETMQECVSEFISFVTGEASDKCHKEKRKTVNGDDICWAMTTLGFDDYAEPLKRYLQRYRELEGERSAQQSKPSSNEDQKNKTTNYGAAETTRKTTVPTTPLKFNVIDRNNSPLPRRF
ncbi:nuclear transcription factor Y subunit B-1-like [Juglans microcarpa x Juglans regia]|uniref:nuclear transcription factor Y subunit B-1-like n=1 Tax=Juglans microcarpa x Juglans regia TaxID=2249226 RepID=UPI001B7F3F14|nr:nuclear transcription factor Y subunit B-1-like [Juglans microcarpa x Juglans regia]